MARLPAQRELEKMRRALRHAQMERDAAALQQRPLFGASPQPKHTFGRRTAELLAETVAQREWSTKTDGVTSSDDPDSSDWNGREC